MNSDQQRHIEELRATYEKRLRVLEIQAAAQGLQTPPATLTEIEEIKNKIASLLQGAGSETPFRVDYDYTPRHKWYDGIFDNFDPNKPLRYYIEENIDLVWYAYPQLQLDIVGLAHNEPVIIAPYLVVNILNIEPITEEVDYFGIFGKGAVGSPDYFSAVLSSSQDSIFGAPYVEGYNYVDRTWQKVNKIEGVGYFTLTSGEVEVFILDLSLEHGFRYRFRVGINYKYEGKRSIYWIKRNFQAGIPLKAREWLYSVQDEQFVKNTWKNSVLPPLQDDLNQRLTQQMEADRAKVSQSTSFKLPET